MRQCNRSERYQLINLTHYTSMVDDCQWGKVTVSLRMFYMKLCYIDKELIRKQSESKGLPEGIKKVPSKYLSTFRLTVWETDPNFVQ